MTAPTEIRHLSRTLAEFTKTDFELLDTKGRRIGSIAQIDRVESTPSTGSSGWVVPTEMPATFFELTMHASRNGEHYGASNGSTQHKTIEDARETAKAKAAASQKSYRRKFKAA